MNTTEPFTIQDIADKGKGAVATRIIASGELILAESPLVVQEKVNIDNMTILAALARLSDAEQRSYFSLANAHKGKIPPPLGVFRTNALPCGDHSNFDGYSADSGAVFARASRFNSSCEPNVNNYWDPGRQQMTLWSVREIAPGEELCIAYPKRAPAGYVWVHVRNLERLYREIGECGANPSLGVSKVKTALRLLAEENLLGFCGASFYYDGFQFCVSVSDEKNAKAWVKKAYEAYCVERGPDSEDGRKMARYVKNPSAHPAFGMLRKKTLEGPVA